MAEYLSPGVYVEEFDSGIKAMEGVGTSTAGFVGMAQKGPIKGLPVLITSMADYQRRFGGYLPERIYGEKRYLPYAVEQFFNNGGSSCYVMRVCEKRDDADACKEAEGSIPGTGSDMFLRLTASNPGKWGNSILARFTLLTRSRTEVNGLAEDEQKNLVRSEALRAGAAGDAAGDAGAAEPAAGGTGAAEPTTGDAGTAEQPAKKEDAGGAAAEDQPDVDKLTIKVGDASALQNDDLVFLQKGKDGYAFGVVADVDGQKVTLTCLKEDIEKWFKATEPDEQDEPQNKVKNETTKAAGSDGGKDSEGTAGSDGGKDSEGEAGSDSGKDLEGEAGSDGGKDLEGEAGSDGGKDSEGEAGSDSGKDSEGEAGSDGGKDSEGGEAGGGSKTKEDKSPEIFLYLAEWGLTIQDDTASEQYESLSFNPDRSNYAENALEKSQIVRIKVDKEKLKAGTIDDILEKGEEKTITISLKGGSDGKIQPTIDPSMYKGDDGAPDVRTGLTAFKTLSDVSIMAIPGITDKTVQSDLVSHCESMGNRFAILDMPFDNKEVSALQEFRENVDTSYAAMYHPWLQCYDPLARRNVYLPPSGAMAGIYGRTDNTRGVHKAPANEIVRNCTGLSVKYNEAEQGKLNPKGINLIRALPGQGIRVWGARTCSSDGNWKYINVRRLFIFIEESIRVNTNWAVFEPNDEMLWSRVEGTIRVFLTTQWRNGALAGSTADEAFFINIGKSTMTEDDILNGRLICVIGVAPVRPAEFVIFRITQKMDSAQ